MAAFRQQVVLLRFFQLLLVPAGYPLPIAYLASPTLGFVFFKNRWGQVRGHARPCH